MSKEKKSSIKITVNVVIIFTLSTIITFMFAGFSATWPALILNIIYGSLIGFSIAIGSGFISKKMLAKGNWMRSPIKNFIGVIIAITVYIFIDLFIINIIWFHLTQGIDFKDMLSSNYLLWMYLTEFAIGIIIYLIMLSVRFAENLNQYYLEAEENKNEINKYKYFALKNQVNPHFLFNSLNALSSLMYKDVEKADEFTYKLSNIYRYVLQVENSEITPINEELNFIKDYLFLHQIRFSNQLKFSIDIESTKDYVIPMALQFVVENAIKHNVIDENNELKITISQEGDFIKISNNKTVKVKTENSNGIGLKNIARQYKYLSKHEIKIIDTDNYFEIYLPILKTDDINE